MQLPVYLDYAAATPADPLVVETMAACLTLDGNFGNPASRSHKYGWLAEEAVETGRRHLAKLIAADAREIVWTSGATEADNLAIIGAVEHLTGNNPASGKHIITSAIEHKAVLDTCAYLATRGYEVTYLTPQADGRILPAQVAEALRDDTVLVSLMYVNNELGSINPVAEIGRLLREKGVLFHVDAAQAVGKLTVNVEQDNIDLMSISAHKMYGPKGIGALYVKRGIKIAEQIHGGGHERGMRSGTLPTHQIAGFGKAAELASQLLVEEESKLAALKNRLWQGLSQLDGVTRNGSAEHGVAGILNVSFAGVDGESLLLSLPEIAVSSGSACNSATMAPSYVLKAVGLNDELAHASIRFSIGRFSTEEEIDHAVQHVSTAIKRLKGLAA